jgi:hypothetical protein
MILEDLEHIFQSQMEEGTTKLYFMITDGDAFPMIERHSANDLVGLLPMLSSFQYAGKTMGIPKFIK